MLNIRQDHSEEVRYDYSELPVYIRRSLLSSFPGYAADSHWHNDIELIYILSGEMKYNINGTVITMPQGHGVLVNAKQLHFGFSDTGSECDFICVLFHPMLLCSCETFEKDFVKPIINSALPFIELSEAVPWQKEVLNCIYKMWESKGKPSSPLCSHGLVNLIWSQIIDNISLSKVTKTSDVKITMLKMMISYIHENYKEKILLEDIAAAAKVSKRTCESVFSKYLNCTPISYLTDYRLKKSIELMNTGMSILDISIAVGFSSASYYAESFKRSFGVTPREYKGK